MAKIPVIKNDSVSLQVIHSLILYVYLNLIYKAQYL